MANVPEGQGKLGGAMGLYNKALAITIKALGPGHADVGGACYNMANVEGGQQNYQRAFELFSGALRCDAISSAAHGEGHPRVVGAAEAVERARALL